MSNEHNRELDLQDGFELQPPPDCTGVQAAAERLAADLELARGRGASLNVAVRQADLATVLHFILGEDE